MVVQPGRARGGAQCRQVPIRQALAAGFAQYATVYVAWSAEQMRFDDYAAYQAGMQRARGFYRRAAGYALAALEIAQPGWERQLAADPAIALALAGEQDVPSLFWLGASWLLALATSLEDPELIGRFPVAVALLARCEDLAPGCHHGAVNEALIAVEARLAGPEPRARSTARYERALAAGGGAPVMLAFALAVALPARDREQFRALLEQALASGPPPEKLWTWGGDPGAARMLAAVGFRPVVVDSTDVLPAPQSGLIDAFPGAPLSALWMQWFARAPHMLDLRLSPLAGATVISAEAWNRVPPELRPGFMSAARQIGAWIQSQVRSQEGKTITVM